MDARQNGKPAKSKSLNSRVFNSLLLLQVCEACMSGGGLRRSGGSTSRSAIARSRASLKGSRASLRASKNSLVDRNGFRPSQFRLPKSYSDPNLLKTSHKYTRGGLTGRFIGGQFVSYKDLAKGGSVLDLAFEPKNLLNNKKNAVSRFLGKIKNKTLRKLIVTVPVTIATSVVIILLGVGLNYAFNPPVDFYEIHKTIVNNYLNGTDIDAITTNKFVTELQEVMEQLEDYNELQRLRASQGRNTSEDTNRRIVELASTAEDIRHIINKRQQKRTLEEEGYEVDLDENEEDEDDDVETLPVNADNATNLSERQIDYLTDNLVMVTKRAARSLKKKKKKNVSKDE